MHIVGNSDHIDHRLIHSDSSILQVSLKDLFPPVQPQQPSFLPLPPIINSPSFHRNNKTIPTSSNGTLLGDSPWTCALPFFAVRSSVCSTWPMSTSALSPVASRVLKALSQYLDKCLWGLHRNEHDDVNVRLVHMQQGAWSLGKIQSRYRLLSHTLL